MVLHKKQYYGKQTTNTSDYDITRHPPTVC
jgi:hypothetical protein